MKQKVTPENIKGVLLGDPTFKTEVLHTTENDYVTFYYSGLGGKAVIRFGSYYPDDQYFDGEPDPAYVRL
ncbi:unnamed protein product [Gongylonema pulchrum]|uniref:DM13 domain-containing protein n=1 Tax=Gongylonema pulchrum TaxID=637853 RepID=A0A183D0J4_9BILA|nr:unnamed protein product [Gongylonema pulchrum]